MSNQTPPAIRRKLSPWKGFISVFLAVFMVVFLSGAVITFLLPESYTAVARVRPSSAEQFKYLQSSKVLLNAADELGLRRRLSEQYAETELLSDERMLQVLRRSVQVRRVSRTDLVEIRAYSRTSQEAADLANAIAQAGRRGTAGPPDGTMKPIQIIDLAVPPRKPARPNKALNLALAALVGIALGAMAGGVGARLAIGVGKVGEGERENVRT